MSSNILFMLSHQPNPRFVKQILFFSQNHMVDVVYACRENLKQLQSEYENKVDNNFCFGKIEDGGYFKRILQYFSYIRKLRKILSSNKYNIVLVNNVDMIFLHWLSTFFSNFKGKYVIEISDLRAHAYGKGVKNHIIRAFDRLMFKKVSGLIVTSDKFFSAYYKKCFSSQPFVLENKPLSWLCLTEIRVNH